MEGALGERRGKAPRPPLRRVRGDHARQGWKPDGRDAAPQAAWGGAQEPSPKGDAQPSTLRKACANRGA